mmetsp:Transcript_47605/g.134077  ORF Transcript_47605/g.134077 Transcript_47605/m.134077 type:complete len:220 (-) Transcript_47605:908-1567(-)
MMQVRLAPRPTSLGLTLPKAMSVTISRPAMKVWNSNHPKPRMKRRPETQPASAPPCVAKLPRPMKTGTAMETASRSAMRKRLMMLPPKSGSFVPSVAMMIAGMFTATRKSCPASSDCVGESFLERISLESTESKPVCNESTEDATMQTASAKARPLKPEDCMPSSSKKPSAGMATPAPVLVSAWACANMPARPKRIIVGKMSATPKAQPLRNVAAPLAA